MTAISSSTVFARPLCRYGTQFGPVSVFAHEQVRNFCIIRSDITGRILGVSVAICPAESLVREDARFEATPSADNPLQVRFAEKYHPLRTQDEVNLDY